MTYESAYNKFSYLIFIVLSFPLGVLIYIYLTEPEESKPCLIFGVLLMSLFLFLLHAYKNTRYTINKDFLTYQMSFFHGEIDIQKIRKIEYNNSIFVNSILKIGWSHKGLIITYNNYDDIFLAPKNKEDFVIQILKINPRIKIENPANQEIKNEI